MRKKHVIDRVGGHNTVHTEMADSTTNSFVSCHQIIGADRCISTQQSSSSKGNTLTNKMRWVTLICDNIFQVVNELMNSVVKSDIL